MRAYNLEATQITIGENKRWALQLGESGRSRTQTLVRCEEGIQDGDLVSYTMPKEGRPGVASIFRTEQETEKGFIIRISTYGGYSRNALGCVAYPQGNTSPILIAQGDGAFGDAGRCGSWRDVVVAAQVGAIIRVVRTGQSPVFLVVTENAVSKLTLEQAQFEGIPTLAEKYCQIT